VREAFRELLVLCAQVIDQMARLFGLFTVNRLLEASLFTPSSANCLTIGVFIKPVVGFNVTTLCEFGFFVDFGRFTLRLLGDRGAVLLLVNLHFHFFC
jgi:hypothetical protein